MSSYNLTHLAQLENEAVFVMREVAAQFERPVLLFSGGKDSLCVVALALRAFAPGRMPFPLVHIDTGHNFPETTLSRQANPPALARNDIGRIELHCDQSLVSGPLSGQSRHWQFRAGRGGEPRDSGGLFGEIAPLP